MQTRHIWSVLCRKAVIEDKTNIVSLNEVIERVSIDAAIPPGQKVSDLDALQIPWPMSLVSWFSGKPNSFIDVRISATSPLGVTNVLAEGVVGPFGPNGKARLTVTIQGFAVKEGGEYLISVMMSEKDAAKFQEVASIPLEVEITLASPL